MSALLPATTHQRDGALEVLLSRGARMGRILEVVERTGIRGDCAFFLVADHGMEESDPAVRGDWDAALAESNVQVRDEGYGFLYLSGS